MLRESASYALTSPSAARMTMVAVTMAAFVRSSGSSPMSSIARLCRGLAESIDRTTRAASLRLASSRLRAPERRPPARPLARASLAVRILWGSMFSGLAMGRIVRNESQRAGTPRRRGLRGVPEEVRCRAFRRHACYRGGGVTGTTRRGP